MIRIRFVVVVTIVALTGCSNADADRLGRVARTVAAKFDGLTEGAQTKLAIGWRAGPMPLVEAPLDRKVTARMDGDKQLVDCKLEVDSPGPGLVRLRGAAPLAQRRRAADLAWSTVGVTKVIDETTEE